MSNRPQTMWTCEFCGKPIYWDELFTSLSNKKVVHYACLREKAIKTAKISQELLNVVLDSLEDELNKIIMYRQRLEKVGDNEEIKKVLKQVEKNAERSANLLTRLIEKLSDVLS